MTANAVKPERISNSTGPHLVAVLVALCLAVACRNSQEIGRGPVVSTGAAGRLEARPGSVRFAVIGDSGRGSQAQYELAQQMSLQRKRFEFSFVIMLGDNVYDSDAPKDYIEKFERPYEALLDAGVKFYAARGNHDVGEQWLYPLFNTGGHRYFTFRQSGGPIGALAGNDVQFFAIDSVSIDDEQLGWLDRELQQSSAEWKICFLHHPLYTSGRYGWSALATRRRLEPLLVQHGVDVVFSGHEHVYERLQPQRGIIYFVSGAAGSVRRDDLRLSSASAAGFDDDLHFMLIDIAGDVMRFEVIARTGAVVDAGSVERKALPAGNKGR
jgi:predicted phosphodiesterase